MSLKSFELRAESLYPEGLFPSYFKLVSLVISFEDSSPKLSFFSSLIISLAEWRLSTLVEFYGL